MRQADARETRPRVGLGAVQPRELGDRERGDRHRAARVRPRRRAPELLDQPAASGADSVSFHSFAGPHDLVRVVEHDEPVLLPGDGDGVDVAHPASVRRRACSASHQACRILLALRRRRRRMRRTPVGDELAGVGVAHLDLRRLRRRVDTEHDRHSLGHYAVRSDRVRVRVGRGTDGRARRRRLLQRRARRRRVPRCDRRGAIETVVPKRRGVGGIALHADGGVVCSGSRHRARRDGETATLFTIDGISRAGTTCARMRRAASTRARCASRSSTATRPPVPGECWRIDGPATATALYGDVVHAERDRALTRRADDLPLRHACERGDRAHAARRRQRATTAA